MTRQCKPGFRIIRSRLSASIRTPALGALALALVLGAAGAAVGAQEAKTLVSPSSGPGGEAVVAGYAGSYALVVGMSDYAPGTGWADLESVPGEVEKVERALRARGFEVVTHLDPDAETLEKAFEDFIGNYDYDEDHRLLFYVSGHGYTLAGAGAGGGKRGFLAPTDAPNPLSDAPGFRRKALSMAQIVTWAREMTARHALFLFDSCFSGTVFQTRALPDEPPHIGRLAGEPARQFITAGSANEEMPARSVFTPAFVDALEHREGDLNGDGYVTGMELGMHLQEKVPRHTEQTPQFGKIRDHELSRGDFVFRVGQPGVIPPTSPPPLGYAKLSGERIAKLEEGMVVAGGDGAEDEVQPAVPADAAEVERGLALSREERRLVQMGLSVAGYDPGPADGMIGRNTRRAIRRWQGSRGEWETGYLDADEAKELLGLGRQHEARLLAERREKEEAEQRARAEAERKAKAAARRDRERALSPGTRFRDCDGCPLMVVVPKGSYMMGSPSEEAGRDDDEGPRHRVTIARPFAVGVYEVTRGEYGRFVSATRHASRNSCWTYEDGEGKVRSGRSWRNPGFRQTDGHPVVCVSHENAKAYVRWLSRMTGVVYRLSSESEWEYVARAGTRTRYWWGDEIGSNRANCDGCENRWDGKWTVPVGSFSANAFGLFDVHGNVGEWVEDCWNESYLGAPSDGSAWESGSCSRRVQRGGSWYHGPWYLRSATRNSGTTSLRFDSVGFRVARTLTP